MQLCYRDLSKRLRINLPLFSLPVLLAVSLLISLSPSRSTGAESASSVRTTSSSSSDRAILGTTFLSLSLDLPPEICRDTVFSSTSIDVCAVLLEDCLGDSLATLPGRELLFFINEGNCGVNQGQEPVATAITDANGEACITVNRLDTLLNADEISFRVKFQGEPKPPDEEPPNSACDPNRRVNLSTSNDCVVIPILDGCQDDGVDFSIITGDSADLYYVKTIDLDRDNYVDVVYSGSSAAGLFVAYGTPGGGLETAIDYLSIGQAAFDFGYVNGDTLVDIISVSNNVVWVLYNQGGRQFTIDSIGVAAAGQEPSGSARDIGVPEVTVVSLNNDLYADAIVTPGVVMYGDATGSFDTRLVLSTDMDASVACDFDRDGWSDLVALAGNSIISYINDGTGILVEAASVTVTQPQVEFPPIMVAADLNRDGSCDVALVVPDSATPNQSTLTVVLFDAAAQPVSVNAYPVSGIAYALSVADVDKDQNLDLILANGTANNLEVYKGDGSGAFQFPIIINLGTDTGATTTLAALDIDRDGNADFVSGGPGGGNLVIALNQQTDDPTLVDEMTTVATTQLNIEVVNPDGFVISQDFRSVAGSDYQVLDINGDGQLDERAIDYNLQYGEYTITFEPEADSSDDIIYSAAIGIDGSQNAVVFKDYNDGGVAKGSGLPLTFYYTVEPVSSIQPENGIPIDLSRPTFDWNGLIDTLPQGLTYHFQLDRYFDFRSPIFDVTDLAVAQFEPFLSLGNDSVFYWHFRAFDGNTWTGYSRTFAVFITGVCCIGSIANVSMDPDGNLDIEDVTVLAAFLFSAGELPNCPGVGNANGDASENLDVSDLTYLVDYLFQGGPPPPLCP